MTLYDHDYVKYPELTNTELQYFQFSTPHQQITEDFLATVVKVHDGDTITLKTAFRDFDFPLRLLDIDAPELNQEGGKEAGEWLRNQILNQEVQILIDKFNRVGKYGRLLGQVMYGGLNMNEAIVRAGYAAPFTQRNEGKIPDASKIFLEGEI